jgi:hypothetical protein
MREFVSEGRQPYAFSLAFHPDGELLIAGCGSGHGPADLMLIDSVNQTTNLRPSGHETAVYDVSFSPDGRSLVSCGPLYVRVVDAQSFEDRFPPLNIPTAYNAKYSPDGKRIVTACEDATVRIWDSLTGMEAISLNRGRVAGAFSIDISDDGRSIVAQFQPGFWKESLAIWTSVKHPDETSSPYESMEASLRGLNPRSPDWRYRVRVARALADRLTEGGQLKEDEKSSYLAGLIDRQSREAPGAVGDYAAFFDRCKHLATSRQVWRIAGPFGGGPNRLGLDQRFPPEESTNPGGYDGPRGHTPWLTRTVYEGDYVDLLRIHPESFNVVAYALTHVSSAIEQDVVFRFGSDDGAKIWLDDKLIYDNDSLRPLVSLDLADRLSTQKLAPGMHKLLIKVENALSEWGFAIDAETPDGLPAVLDWSAMPPDTGLPN